MCKRWIKKEKKDAYEFVHSVWVCVCVFINFVDILMKPLIQTACCKYEDKFRSSQFVLKSAHICEQKQKLIKMCFYTNYTCRHNKHKILFDLENLENKNKNG